MTARLTPRQEAILAFIVDYARASGYPPTRREIGARFGIASTNGVADHLAAIERKGWIKTRRQSARAITVLRVPGAT